MKFGHESEDESDLHSEPVEDTEHGAVPKKIEMVENELDCHVESIDVGSQQPHSRIAEMQAAEALMKRMPKVPKDGYPEPASVDGTESLVAAEPTVTDNSRYIEVYEDNYLDDFYDDF